MECESRFKRIKRPCLCCGLPLDTGAYPVQLCGSCLFKPPPFTHIIAAFDYADPLKTLITAFKYQARLSHGKVLSSLLLKRLLEFYRFRSLPALMIPMPLHKKRLRQRGFNQAMEIARYLSPALNIPVEYKRVLRQRHTQRQQGLDLKRRQRNLRQAFSILPKGGAFPERVAIVDDVVTTTASVRSLSDLLLQNGVQEIHVWSLARTCKSTAT